MDSSVTRQEEKGLEEGTRTKALKQSREKPALSPIEEETDSSVDSVVNLRDIDNFSNNENLPYDLGNGNDYEEVVRDVVGEETPFLTARNASDRETKSCDSSATTSYEGNSLEEEEEEEEESSLGGESTSDNVDYYRDDNDLEPITNDLEIIAEDDCDKTTPSRPRPKSAPSCSLIESSDTSRNEKFGEITMTLDWLKSRVVKSERDIFQLKKQLRMERSRGRKLTRRHEEDGKVTRETLRIDLELWIKKLNDGLGSYLAEWQKRERLRLNEEISRISDLYSQEIAKSLRLTLKEWQSEDARHIFEMIERREKIHEDNVKVNAKVVYEKIQTHLENLEKRNRKSYAGLCKQIDKWEERLREEIVKIHQDELRKLRQEVLTWHEKDEKKMEECRTKRERWVETKRSGSFLEAEALSQVEENLLKRLRDSSTKDLRRTEQIVRTELESQRRELAKKTK